VEFIMHLATMASVTNPFGSRPASSDPAPSACGRRGRRARFLALALAALAASTACGGAPDGADAAFPTELMARGSSSPTGSTAPAGPISISPAAITAGQAATVTVTLADAATSASGVVVYVSLPAAKLAGPRFIVIPNGQRGGTFTVYANPYLAAATTALVSWTTTTPNPAAFASLALPIAPAAAPPAGPAPNVASVQLDAAVVVSGTPVAGLLTLSGPAPAGGLAVRLAFSFDFFHQNGSIPDVVVVPAGAVSAPFTVQTHLAAGATSTTDFVVASVFGGPYAGAPLTIAAP
jgi:hypothetical protein